MGEAILDLPGAGSVGADYQQQSKLITADADLSVEGAHFKWYDIRVPEVVMAHEIRDEARELITSEVKAGRIRFEDELGFVMLHLCGASVRLLLICTWRNNNELWLTSYAKQGDGPYELTTYGSHRGTYCVWELGAVMHERQAWVRYLYSARDAAARQAYVTEPRFSGLVG